MSLRRTGRKADGGGNAIRTLHVWADDVLDHTDEFGDAFDYCGVDFRGWCGAAGFRLFDVIPLAAGSTAAVAYNQQPGARGWCENQRMPHGRMPPRPEDAQADAEEWARFFDYFGHATVRRGIRVLSGLPSAPRCEACGNPFTGFGGWLMRRAGKSPSRKNPRWCQACFEKAPTGGVTLPIGVLFADIRDSTALAETLPAGEMVAALNRFYSKLTQVIVQHGIVDKLIGDAVMGLYFAPLTSDGRYVDAMVSDARAILGAQGYGTPGDPQLQVGIGLDVGPAYVGIVGEGEIRDFTAIGDVVNTASRLQGVAAGGEIVMSEAVVSIAGVDEGEVVKLDLKGKAWLAESRLPADPVSNLREAIIVVCRKRWAHSSAPVQPSIDFHRAGPTLRAFGIWRATTFSA